MTAPGAMRALQQLGAATKHAGLPQVTLLLVALRASQINSCSVCVDLHSRELNAEGEPDERIFTIAAWRETPYFSDAERGALALTEAAAASQIARTRSPTTSGRRLPGIYDHRQLGALLLSIAAINAWNRINATTRQITGEWVSQWIRSSQGAVEAV